MKKPTTFKTVLVRFEKPTLLPQMEYSTCASL